MSLPCCEHRASQRDDDIDLETNELGCHLGEAFGVSFRPAIRDRNGAPPGSSRGRAAAVQARRPIGPEFKSWPCLGKVPDGRQLARLLRACRERPCCRRASDKRDELAPSHCCPRGLDGRS